MLDELLDFGVVDVVCTDVSTSTRGGSGSRRTDMRAIPEPSAEEELRRTSSKAVVGAVVEGAKCRGREESMVRRGFEGKEN